MTRTELVQNEIARFLSTKDPEVLCIRGEWGVGKTYTWQAMLDKAKAAQTLGLGRYAYVSLFGINSLEGLKFAIFENSEFLIPEQVDGFWMKAKRKGSRWLGQVQKSRNLAAGLPYIGDFVKNAEPLFFSAVRNQIICIDDLERRSEELSVANVLGLASFLKEQRKCKIVLLLNDEQLDEDGGREFSTYLEKVVDVAVKFAPEPEDSVRIALPGTDAVSKAVGNNCKNLRISNIRVVKKIERFVRNIESLVRKFDEGVFQQAAHTDAPRVEQIPAKIRADA